MTIDDLREYARQFGKKDDRAICSVLPKLPPFIHHTTLSNKLFDERSEERMQSIFELFKRVYGAKEIPSALFKIKDLFLK